VFGEIDEHDEGECDADVGLALDRCADELDKGSVWGEGDNRFLPVMPFSRASSSL
jgi:hypothetical protein